MLDQNHTPALLPNYEKLRHANIQDLRWRCYDFKFFIEFPENLVLGKFIGPNLWIQSYVYFFNFCFCIFFDFQMLVGAVSSVYPFADNILPLFLFKTIFQAQAIVCNVNISSLLNIVNSLIQIIVMQNLHLFVSYR